MAAVWICIQLARSDWREHRLPNRLVGALLGVAIATAIVAAISAGTAMPAVHALAGAALFGAPVLMVHLISPKLMGFGDVKLALVLGLWLGWHDASSAFAALFLAFVLAFPESLWRLIRQRRHPSDATAGLLAFGPYLITAAVITILFVFIRSNCEVSTLLP